MVFVVGTVYLAFLVMDVFWSTIIVSSLPTFRAVYFVPYTEISMVIRDVLTHCCACSSDDMYHRHLLPSVGSALFVSLVCSVGFPSFLYWAFDSSSANFSMIHFEVRSGSFLIYCALSLLYAPGRPLLYPSVLYGGDIIAVIPLVTPHDTVTTHYDTVGASSCEFYFAARFCARHSDDRARSSLPWRSVGKGGPLLYAKGIPRVRERSHRARTVSRHWYMLALALCSNELFNGVAWCRNSAALLVYVSFADNCCCRCMNRYYGLCIGHAVCYNCTAIRKAKWGCGM